MGILGHSVLKNKVKESKEISKHSGCLSEPEWLRTSKKCPVCGRSFKKKRLSEKHSMTYFEHTDGSECGMDWNWHENWYEEIAKKAKKKVQVKKKVQKFDGKEYFEWNIKRLGDLEDEVNSVIREGYDVKVVGPDRYGIYVIWLRKMQKLPKEFEYWDIHTAKILPIRKKK